ncbi:MAG: ExbD/TolR family protein [bacterium]
MSRQKKNARATEVPTASLADIAFLLLIFFLVTTTIDVDRGIGLTLPDKTPVNVRPKNITTLLINSAGEILLDNETVEIAAVNELIEKKLKENPNLIVSVKTDRKTKYETFIQILDELKMARASRISLAGPEK